MKTIQVAILTIAALTLSGCATGYYQRDYVGYGSGYYYQGYGRSYSSPGTSITYGRYYVQPSYRPEHHHDEHHGWSAPVPHFEHHDGGHGGWQGRDFGRREFGHERHAEQMPHHEQSMPERQERGFGRRDNDGDHQQRGGWGGRFGRRGE
ncbi:MULTISPECIES: hypothetical protein [Methylomonas]|uniref:Lipoprotein n=2 Tax=Methylomonas TaxID=416 RepID=A0A126T3Y1_9GAMM|nr:MULTISPECIES: hypothetical protein [Methylomonas]AMK76793.1 hypothetical protein JT25_009875 [Methylomonas denitrificans]OAH96367.1 hypothetical protein A1342_21270 [Methylomonas methanica]TCV75231.1 hypothetical protein EDE11_13637 [Methylomonas methanica]